MSGDVIEAEGVVVDVKRGDLHVVDARIGGATTRVLAKRSGHLVTNRIRVLPGDVVQIEVTPYDTTRGRIVFRGRPEVPNPGTRKGRG